MQYGVAFIDEPALLVSDIHCGCGSCKVRNIAYLAAREGASLIVLGDLFDKLHTNLNKLTLERALSTAFKQVKGIDVYYVISRSSHDPLLDDEMFFDLGRVRVHVYPSALVAQISGLRAFLTHGDLAMRNGAHAFIVNATAMLFGTKLYLEKRLREKLRLPQSWWLIMGHTHIPGIDHEAKVANTGSWRGTWVHGTPYWRPPSHTFILVERKCVKLLSAREGL